MTVGGLPACVVIATVVSMSFFVIALLPLPIVCVWIEPRTMPDKSTFPVTAYSTEGASVSPNTSCAAVSPYSFGASATCEVLPSLDDFGVSPVMLPQ